MKTFYVEPQYHVYTSPHVLESPNKTHTIRLRGQRKTDMLQKLNLISEQAMHNSLLSSMKYQDTQGFFPLLHMLYTVLLYKDIPLPTNEAELKAQLKEVVIPLVDKEVK